MTDALRQRLRETLDVEVRALQSECVAPRRLVAVNIQHHMNSHVQFLNIHSPPEIDQQMNEPSIGGQPYVAQINRLAGCIFGIDQQRLDFPPIVESAVDNDPWRRIRTDQ